MSERNLHSIETFGRRLEDTKLLEVLHTITAIPRLEFPIVCLPDIHHKKHLEAPTSIAAASADIIPALSTPTLGCAMGAIVTSLTTADINEQSIDRFYESLHQYVADEPSLGTIGNLTRTFLLWLGIIRRPVGKYDFTEAELPSIIERGAKAVLEKYRLNPSILNRLEHRGNVVNRQQLKRFGLRNLLPRSGRKFTLHNIGYGFGGNHFLEIQRVESVIDRATAARWKLKKDQIVIMYHGGEGAMSFHIGRYFSNRKKASWKENLLRFPAKFWFHFGSWQGLVHCLERWRYYFRPEPFQAIPANSFEGQRFLTAVNIGANYSYAFRMGMIARIIDALHAALPDTTFAASLLWDATHTSISKEIIKNKKLIVHRSGATLVVPNRPVIVSGHNNVASYIGIGLADAEHCLYSIDHGAGEAIKYHKTAALSQPHPDQSSTHMYKVSDLKAKTKIRHHTAEGLEYVVKKLEAAHIVRPVVLTRPLAVLKE